MLPRIQVAEFAMPLTERRPRGPGPPACPVRGAPRCRGGKNVETPHPVETSHAYSVFYFRRAKSFHANGRPSPDGRAASRRTVLKGTMPLLS